MSKKDKVFKSHVDNSDERNYHVDDRPGMEGGIMSAEEDELLTVQEVCNLLKVSKSHIYSLTHQKKIPHIKMGKWLRFWRSEIDKWLRSQEVKNVGLQDKEQVVRIHNIPGQNKV